MEGQQLPVRDYEDQIIKTIRENQVTIIVAETGAGKSTQVPQMLLKEGLNIIVTEPRRLAARSLARRVADEMKVRLGGLVGYRTAFENESSSETRCLFCTDGLEMIRELHRNYRPNALVIDEVHEWNLNIETLVAWTKKNLANFPDTKIVIMSATLESGRLSAYFNDAPVIEVPGRIFPVEVRERSKVSRLEDEVENLVRARKNVLVFQPGKKEIYETISALEGVGAKVLPLHGELDPEEQDLVFRNYKMPKVIVATNVAQTSITVDDIDAVVDSGEERRVETVDGVEGLYLRRTSKADDEQRKGRAGRCRPGIYINCYPYTDEQLDFPRAEIQRVRLDRLVLRLAYIGFDATDLEFFHQPDHNALVDAKKRLYGLGAMDKEGQVTEVGEEMLKYPVAVELARMIVQASKLGVVDDVVTIAACLEVNGIAHREGSWRHLTQEKESDLLAQLDLFKAGGRMKSFDELIQNGIHKKSFERAYEIRNRILDILEDTGIDTSSSGDRSLIRIACVAGMVNNFYRRHGPCYLDGEGYAKAMEGMLTPMFAGRKMSRHSVLELNWPVWIVGLPIDIDKMRLVTMVTEVGPALMSSLAPHLVGKENKRFRLENLNTVVFERVDTFNGVELSNDGQIHRCEWNSIDEHLPLGPRGRMIKRMLERDRAYLERPQPIPLLSELVEDCLDGILPFPGSVRDPAEHIFNMTVSPPLELPKPVVVEGPWTDIGGRWYKCPKGHANRAKKNAVKINCEFCTAEKIL